MKKKDKKIGPIKRKTYYIIAVLFLFLLFGVVLAHNFSSCHISLFGGSCEEVCLAKSQSYFNIY